MPVSLERQEPEEAADSEEQESLLQSASSIGCSWNASGQRELLAAALEPPALRGERLRFPGVLGFAAFLALGLVSVGAYVHFVPSMMAQRSRIHAGRADGLAMQAVEVSKHGVAGDKEAFLSHAPTPPEQLHEAAPSNPFASAFGALTGALQQAGLALGVVTSTSTTTVTTSTGTTTTATTTTGTTTTGTTTTGTTTTRTTSTTISTSSTSMTATTTITTTTTQLCSLFCFAVVRNKGFEPVLMQELQKQNLSIFACEEYVLYANGGKVLIDGKPIVQLKTPDVKKGNLNKKGTTTSSWLNTLIFLEAWRLLLADGRWWKHEWVVKVDPDAVFFPDRLKVSLYPHYRAHQEDGPALMLANCDRSWNNEPYSLKLFGSLEVFSRNAVGMYRAKQDKCKKGLDWKGWGEDFYMQECMEMLQVQKINGVSLLGDINCHPAACTDTSKVAYHAYKDVAAYFDCWGQSHAAAKAAPPQAELFVKRQQ